MRRYLLIGSGPAAITAAETIRCHDEQGEIILLGEDPHGYYSRPGLAYVLTGEIPEKFLYPFSQNDFKRLGIDLRRAHAARIDPAGHRVELQTGESLPFDRLLIATGSLASRPRVPGADLEGVVKLDDLEDVHQILKLARKARSAVVVGGGITSLEIVEGLVARRVKTHYFMRGDRYWGNVLDKGESHIVEERLKEDKVQIHHRTELAEILGSRGQVGGVRTQDGKQIPCNIVAIAIGIRPRRELAEAAGLKTDRGILVDQYLQTSAADIFAAGDVAQVLDPRTGLAELDSLWGPACSMGRAAGANLAGLSTAYVKEYSFNVTRLANLTTTIIGPVGGGEDRDLATINRGDSESWRRPANAEVAFTDVRHNHLRLVIGEKALLGALLMGDQTLSLALQQIIRQGIDITSIHDRLLEPAAPLGEILAAFWKRWKGDLNHAG